MTCLMTCLTTLPESLEPAIITFASLFSLAGGRPVVFLSCLTPGSCLTNDKTFPPIVQFRKEIT